MMPRWCSGDDEADIYHVEEADDDHSVGEDRYMTFGSRPNDRRVVLRNSWTDRSTTKRQVTRIISARRANNYERKQYVEEIRDQ